MGWKIGMHYDSGMNKHRELPVIDHISLYYIRQMLAQFLIF